MMTNRTSFKKNRSKLAFKYFNSFDKTDNLIFIKMKIKEVQ